MFIGIIGSPLTAFCVFCVFYFAFTPTCLQCLTESWSQFWVKLDDSSPRAIHKLLGNFLATSRIFRANLFVQSNFLHSEQFVQLFSNSETSKQLLVLLALLSYFTMFQQTIHEFPVKKGAKSSPPGAYHWRKIKVAGLLLGREVQRKFKMVNEDSHSTNLSVSGEEGHSTILLANYFFWFYLRTKLFSNVGYAAKFHKNALKSYFCSTICIFQHHTQKRFLLFGASSEQLSLPKATFDCFYATFEQFFEKLRETFWKISSNLWKALLIPVVYICKRSRNGRNGLGGILCKGDDGKVKGIRKRVSDLSHHPSRLP